MKVTKETLVPISMVVSILGGVPYLTAVYAEMKTNSSDIKQLKTYNLRKEDRDLIRDQREIELLERLARIEEKIIRIDRSIRR